MRRSEGCISETATAKGMWSRNCLNRSLSRASAKFGVWSRCSTASSFSSAIWPPDTAFPGIHSIYRGFGQTASLTGNIEGSHLDQAEGNRLTRRPSAVLRPQILSWRIAEVGMNATCDSALASNYRELVRHLDLIHAINMCSVDSSSISARHLSTASWV